MKVATAAEVKVSVNITLDEDEIRALDALAGYGDDAFIKAFYEKLGSSYMLKHEAGLRKFLRDIRIEFPHVLFRADEARKVFNK